jgi:hypothetical protein
VPLAPTHGDLKAEHILVDGDRVCFIDLGSFVGADPVLDPAGVLARLAALPGLGLLPPSRARRAAQVFAEAYFAQVPAGWRRRVPWHYAGANLHLAVSFFRSQEPGWREQLPLLIGEAKAALTGKV